jgi:FAD:protein FMN transferase
VSQNRAIALRLHATIISKVMFRKIERRFAGAAAVLLMAIFTGCNKGNDYIALTGVAQGSTYHIVYEPVDSSSASVRDSVNLYFKQIDNSVSGYDSTSLLYKFNNNLPVKPDKIFIDNFVASQKMYKVSNGAFDASSAPLFDLWGFGFKNKANVTKAKIDSIMQFTGMEHFKLVGDSITKDDPRCELNFNAIAQGYTADYFAERFRKMGIKNFMIEIGGEIFAQGVNPKGKEWNIGVDKPVDGNNSPGEMIQDEIRISGKGLVTSGDYRKYYVENGKKYAHTINPKTGYPVQHNLLSATVVAPNATAADAYATYFMVVGLERAKEIIAETPDIEALLIYGDQNNMKQYVSEGMKKMTKETK